VVQLTSWVRCRSLGLSQRFWLQSESRGVGSPVCESVGVPLGARLVVQGSMVDLRGCDWYSCSAEYCWAACSAERCSAQSTRHRGRAAGRSVFLLDGQERWCIFMSSLFDESVESTNE